MAVSALTFLYDAMFLEELCRFGVAAPAWDMHSYIIAPFLTHFGMHEQMCRVAPEDGRWIADRLDRSPNRGGGSDLKELRTSASARATSMSSTAPRPSSPTATSPTTSCWPPRPIRMPAPRRQHAVVDLNAPGVSRGAT